MKACLLLVALLALSSCSCMTSSRGTVSVTELRRLLEQGPSRAVTRPLSVGRRPKGLFIAIDGLGSDALRAVPTPAMDALRRRGAWTYQSETGDVTKSGPNWSSVLTGVWRDRHHVDSNHFWLERLSLYPDIFARLERARSELETAFVYSWPKLHRFGHEADRRVFDDHEKCRDRCAIEAAKFLLARDTTDFLFVYLLDVDETGHDQGFDPNLPGHRAAIEAVDLAIADLVGQIEARPSYSDEDWIILLTSDHGGGALEPKQHGANVPRERDVPFVVAWIGSSSTAYPGELRPAPRPVDVVPTLLTHFGIALATDSTLDGRPIQTTRAPSPTLDEELLVNGGFEADRSAAADVDVAPLGWREYGCANTRRYDETAIRPTAAGATKLLASRRSAPCAVSQAVDISRLETNGPLSFVFTAELAGAPEVRVRMRDREGAELGRVSSPLDTRDTVRASPAHALSCFHLHGPVPRGTVELEIELAFSRAPGFADNVSLLVSAETDGDPSRALEPCTQRTGEL